MVLGNRGLAYGVGKACLKGLSLEKFKIVLLGLTDFHEVTLQEPINQYQPLYINNENEEN